MAETPRWIKSYTLRVRDFLGLHAWLINLGPGEVTATALCSKPDAICQTDWPYLTADITVDPEIWKTHFQTQTEAAKLIICHELLHILFAGLTVAVQNTLTVMQPKHPNALFTLYDQQEEQTVVRFSRQVYDTLEWHDRQDRTIRQLRQEIKELKQAA